MPLLLPFINYYPKECKLKFQTFHSMVMHSSNVSLPWGTKFKTTSQLWKGTIYQRGPERECCVSLQSSQESGKQRKETLGL